MDDAYQDREMTEMAANEDATNDRRAPFDAAVGSPSVR
jgi:hypothetical protein